jgi:hypothetical protein
MRWVFGVPLIVAAVAGAAQPERPEELLKPAIAAAGGAEVLAKYPAGRLVGKGTMTFAGTETPFACEQSFQIPGQLRTVLKC